MKISFISKAIDDEILYLHLEFPLWLPSFVSSIKNRVPQNIQPRFGTWRLIVF